MNFQDYLKSDGLKKSSNVLVAPSDCLMFKKSTLPNIRFNIHLIIHNEVYEYVVLKNSNTLRTIDSDGNPKNISCFKLYSDDEKKLINNYKVKQDANSVMSQLYFKPITEVVFPKFITQIERKLI